MGKSQFTHQILSIRREPSSLRRYELEETMGAIIIEGGHSVWGSDGMAISNIWMEGRVIAQRSMNLWENNDNNE